MKTKKFIFSDHFLISWILECPLYFCTAARAGSSFTTAQPHSMNPELRSCTGLNHTRGKSEFRNGKDL